MLTSIREIQVLVLVSILLGACGAKLARVARTGTVSAGLGPTELFPRRLRRPAAVTLCVTETSLGVALILTAGRFGAGGPASTVRIATALLFMVAVCGLVELRQHRPDLGCGCFGDLSTRPVGIRSIARACLLAAAALASVGAPALRPPPPGYRAAADLGILLAELLLVALLSPEAGEALMRLGYSEPCEAREMTSKRALAQLHRSRIWRQRAHLISNAAPLDMWRELCWWYVVYPAEGCGHAPGGGQDSAVVFAVQVKSRRPAIHAAIAGPLSGSPPDSGQVRDTGARARSAAL
jgi:hypothetical protein